MRPGPSVPKSVQLARVVARPSGPLIRSAITGQFQKVPSVTPSPNAPMRASVTQRPNVPLGAPSITAQPPVPPRVTFPPSK
jgi:hypothetical protein